MSSRIFGILLLAALFSLSTVSLAHAATETLTVPALAKNTRSMYLDKGDKLSISISVSGGGGNDINFQIQDPTGATIASYPRTTSTSFAFNADKAGSYTLIFDNSFSILSSKQVTVNTNIEKPLIPGTSGGGIPGYPLESIMFGSIVAVCVLLIWNRNHIKKM